MALPRSRYVKDGQEGVYHCFTRCVRRAFLCGFDPITQRDYSHRKQLLLNRLRQLASIFAIDVCAYAIMANHYHLILRILSQIAAAWSDREVAIRWLTLFPHKSRLTGEIIPPTEAQIYALTLQTDRIALLRQRLSSISWFMGRLNEYIARIANKEDDVKGRYWESRFKCQALLDQAAITACMVYVDLNPIRAGLALTPEESEFTSIQERIRNSCSAVSPASCGDSRSVDDSVPSSSWLCPIQSDSGRSGILQISNAQYFDLVDRSGRILRTGKRGAIDPNLVPILLRIGAKPDAWLDTISRFDSRFRLAAGLLSSLRSFADQIGRRWVAGISAARIAFALSPTKST